MEVTKQCPFCAEVIKAQAVICRFCHSNLTGTPKEKKGKFVRVKLKTREKVYYGDIFIPSHLSRVSDVINDERHFISLSDTKEETKAAEIHIGFLAINKNVIEWIRLLEKEQETEKSDLLSRPIFDE
jgi:hypothetical protein